MAAARFSVVGLTFAALCALLSVPRLVSWSADTRSSGILDGGEQSIGIATCSTSRPARGGVDFPLLSRSRVSNPCGRAVQLRGLAMRYFSSSDSLCCASCSTSAALLCDDATGSPSRLRSRCNERSDSFVNCARKSMGGAAPCGSAVPCMCTARRRVISFALSLSPFLVPKALQQTLARLQSTPPLQ
jgi:hypothetical protein